jgi:citrate lyase beta subunit
MDSGNLPPEGQAQTVQVQMQALTQLGQSISPTLDVQQARREGFSGKLAIHPDQVEVINQGFTPSAHDISHAQRIVDAFAQAHGAGAVQLDGKMVDKPHLTQALRLLDLSRKT